MFPATYNLGLWALWPKAFFICEPSMNFIRFSDLCASGKAKKLAITACMRKMLTILNSMLRHHATWQPNYALNA